MVNTRKTTDIWLFNKSFGKDPSLNYINAYHPKEDDAVYHMSSASYQRLNAPIRYRLTPTDSFNDIVNCPYLMFKNANERVYYAFVNECKYINDALAEISFKIDPFTTYLDNGINDEMLVERQTGSFSNPDPELSFNANQFMREIDVLDKNSQVIDNDNEIGAYDNSLLHDCMLIYVRNNYETTDGMTSTNSIDTNGLDNLPSLKRFITYYKDGTTEFNEGRVESYLAELQDRADDGDAIINPNYSGGQIDGVDEGGGRFNGNHTGYDVYVITDLTETNNAFNKIIDNPKFYGSNGTNIIGAEYRKLLRKPKDWAYISDGCYKIGLTGRKEISQPYHLDIGDFDFPDNIPKELQQSPYFKRLFVSNNGNTTISFNPNASPTEIDSNDSNLTSIEVIDSAEMGAPIVYNFNSTDSNNQKQYYVDTTDRTVPVFADPRIIEYLKDLQMINAETKLDVEKLAKRIKSIEDKFTYHINMNQQNYDPLNSDRLKYNQKIDRDNLGRQQTNSRNNLTDTNDTAVANLVKSNSTRLANLERTISTSQANLSRTQGADKESLTNQQATDNSNLDMTYDAKSKNITNNYDHNLFVANNQIALNSLNMRNNNNLDYFRLENERDHSKADLRAEKEYNGLVDKRKVYQNDINARIEARLEDEDMQVNQYTNTEALKLSGGVGDIVGNLPTIAEGFEQFVNGVVLGAVGLTAALAALSIKQRAARINFAHKWYVSGSPNDDSPYYALIKNPSDWIFPADKYVPSFDEEKGTVSADNQNLVGISQTTLSRTSNDLIDEVADQYGDTIGDFGLYWAKTALQDAQIIANYKDNYETYQPTKINNAKSYGDNVVDLEVENRQANFDSNSQYTKDNLADELSRDNNNLSNNRAADTSNLSRTHGSQNFSLNTKQDAAYNNLNASNTTSRNNLKAENSTSEANLDKSNKTAMGNLLRDIKRENDNLKATQDSQTNSLRVDWILGNNGIVLNTALEIVDEYTNFYNDYITRVVNFANRINSAGLRGSVTVTSANYWSQVFSKLNMFKVYDISINARELRYCTNYIKRYGSYCGLVKYGISFDPNTYIRTKDYHMEPVMMPSWAADEISEHLNTGVYIRLRV